MKAEVVLEASRIRGEIAETARWMAAEKLAWGSSGNISARENAEVFHLSASGTWFERLTPDDLVACRLADGTWQGSRKPSKEIGMHRAVYSAREDARWVLHATPPAAAVFACQHRAPSDGAFVEGMAYVGDVAWVEYHHPGSAELALAVGAAAARAHVLLMKNHGVIVFDSERDEARMRLLSLEFACALELAAEQSGHALKCLPRSLAEDFRARRIYRPPLA